MRQRVGGNSRSVVAEAAGAVLLGVVLALIFAILYFTYRSVCRRWHSCPSDRRAYVCGDMGYCSACPDNQYCLSGRPRPREHEQAPQGGPKPGPHTSLLSVQAIRIINGAGYPCYDRQKWTVRSAGTVRSSAHDFYRFALTRRLCANRCATHDRVESADPAGPPGGIIPPGGCRRTIQISANGLRWRRRGAPGCCQKPIPRRHMTSSDR